MVYEPLLKIAVGQHTWLPLWPRWALCNYIHLVLTAKRSLFDCQHLIIPRDTRGEPRATAASSGTIFLQRTAPSSGFPERLGSLPLPHSPHPPEGKGVLGNTAIQRVVISTFPAPRATSHRPQDASAVLASAAHFLWAYIMSRFREPCQPHRDGGKGALRRC